MEGKEFLKQKTNRIGQKLIAMLILVAMFMVDLAPMSQAYEKFFTIKYDLGNGKTSNATNITPGSSVSLIGAPTRTGYVFRYWLDTDTSKIYKVEDRITVDRDYSFKAVWEKLSSNIKYIVHYDFNGGNPANGTSILADELTEEEAKAYKLRAAPTKQGYIFDGWKESSTGKKYAAGTTISNIRDSSFYAVWKENKGRDEVKPSQDGNLMDAESLLHRLGCPTQYIEEIRQGNVNGFNVWWTLNADYIVSNLTFNEAQVLCDGLNSCVEKYNLSGSYSLSGTFKDMQQQSSDPAGWVTRTDYHCKYENHKIIAGSHYEDYDGYGNYLGDIDGYVQYMDPNGDWHGLWFGDVEIPITENGHYIVFVGLYGSDWVERTDFYVDDIDKTAPTFEYTITATRENAQNGNYAKKALNITARDNMELKTIKIGDKTEDVSGKEAKAYKNISDTQDVEVVVTDASGNECKKTIRVEVEKEPPVINSYCVENITKGTKSDSINMVEVNAGDKLRITLTTNEKIRSVGRRVTDTGYEVVSMDGTPIITDKSKYSEINSNTVQFDVEVNDILDRIEIDKEYYLFKVCNISDYCNNTIDFEIPTRIVFDNKAPEIMEFKIDGGKRTLDGRAIKIIPGEKITFSLMVNEKLAENAKISILGKDYDMVYSRKIKKNGEDVFYYTVTIDCTEIAGRSNEVKGAIDVKLTNIKDIVGNEAGEVIYNKERPTSNMVYLNNGVYQSESLYIVNANEYSGDQIIGDGNKDGYVTSYDYKIIQEYLIKASMGEYQENELNEIKKVADINQDGQLTHEDCVEEYNRVGTARNTFTKEVPLKFKVISLDNENNNITWQVTKFGGVVANGVRQEIFVTDEEVTKEIDEEGNLSITINTDALESINIKAVRNGDSEEEVGSLVLYNTKRDGINAGINVISVNNTGSMIIGDANNDGYVTTGDAMEILRESVDYTDLIPEEYKSGNNNPADYNNDGVVNSEDALLVLRRAINLGGLGFIRIANNDTLRLKGFYPREGEIIAPEDSEHAEWSVSIIKGDNDSFQISENDDGTLNITANGVVGDKAVIIFKMPDIDNPNNERTSIIYFEIAEPDLYIDKESIEYDLTEYEKLSDEEKIQAQEIINYSLNIDNKAIQIYSDDENIATVNTEIYGKARIEPKGVGKTNIHFKYGNLEKICEVTVTRSISEINVDKEEVTIIRGQKEEIEITTNENVTENIQFRVEDDSIARIGFNEETGKYEIQGLKEGETEITIYSGINPDVEQKVIRVNVIEPTIPRLIDVSVSEDGYYKEGEEIIIAFTFDSELRGSSPELELCFGDNSSINRPNFTTISQDYKVIRYSYIVGDGDNGPLMIKKLGKGLTDVTGQYEAIVNNTYFAEDEEGVDPDFVSLDGIFKTFVNVIADTTKPTIHLHNNSNSAYSKVGDRIEIIMYASEELKAAPKVTINGLEATVEKIGEYSTVFKASIEVTNSFEDGIVEFVIDNYEDLAGNLGDRLVAKEDNIDISQYIDKSESTDEEQTYTVTYDANGGENAPEKQTKEKGKELTLATEIPSRVGYVFKGWATTKTATEIEYEAGAKYTKDENVTLYAVWSEKTVDPDKDSENKPDEDNKDKNKDNSVVTGKVDPYSGSLPHTGIQTAGFMVAGLIMFTSGLAVYFINKKRNM